MRLRAPARMGPIRRPSQKPSDGLGPVERDKIGRRFFRQAVLVGRGSATVKTMEDRDKKEGNRAAGFAFSVTEVIGYTSSSTNKPYSTLLERSTERRNAILPAKIPPRTPNHMASSA